MSHVRREQLYPLFHLLVLHREGRSALDGLDLDPDLARALRKVPEEAFATPPESSRSLAPDRVRALLDHARGCKECQILVYEDGPYARRPKTARELAMPRSFCMPTLVLPLPRARIAELTAPVRLPIIPA